MAVDIPCSSQNLCRLQELLVHLMRIEEHTRRKVLFVEAVRFEHFFHTMILGNKI